MLLYLTLQGISYVAALAACIMTLARGPTLHRLIALMPTLFLVVYGLAVIRGPERSVRWSIFAIHDEAGSRPRTWPRARARENAP